MYTQHYEENIPIASSQTDVFAYVDDHARLSSHMTKSSWMMGGSRMDVLVDAGHGQRVGSHIRVSGKIFGASLFLDEVITRYEPPRRKEWETVGEPQLIVMGQYQMKVEVEPQGDVSIFRVSIDYKMPIRNSWLGKLFGAVYAWWCVRQMIKSVCAQFPPRELRESGFGK